MFWSDTYYMYYYYLYYYYSTMIALLLCYNIYVTLIFALLLYYNICATPYILLPFLLLTFLHYNILLTPSETKLPFTLNQCQFPICIAFAMTINKSQGQSLSRVGIYLNLFLHMVNYMLLFQE